MKQTAVDWLFAELWDRSKDKLVWHYYLQKAKEMERHQILNAYMDGYFADRIKSVDELNTYYEEIKSVDELNTYYEENYGKK